MRLSADRVVALVRSALSSVKDPKVGWDVVSLGLGYAVRQYRGRASRAHADLDGLCAARVIQRDRHALAGIENAESVEVELVFATPWSGQG